MRRISSIKPRSPIWIIGSVFAHLGAYAALMIFANEYAPTRSTGLRLISGDEVQYAQSVQNILGFREYALDMADSTSRTSRMPGYPLTWLPFRVVFGPDLGPSALVVTQVLLGGLTAYLAAVIALRLTGQAVAFYAALALGALPGFPVVYNASTVPDGLAASVCTLIVASLLLHGERGRWSYSLAAGCLSAYLLFLRPFTLPLILVFGSYVWLAARPGRASSSNLPRRRLSLVLAFLGPILLAEAVWVTRNFVVSGLLVPLQTAGIVMPPAERAAWDWIRSHGGDVVSWRPNTAGAWLREDSIFATDRITLPAAALTRECDWDRLRQARAVYQEWRRDRARADLGNRVAAEFDTCRIAYEAEDPLDHHLLARLRLLRSFLVHSGPPVPLARFDSLPPLGAAAAFKAITSLTYAATVILGLVGFMLLVRECRPEGLLLLAIPTTFALVFPMGLRYVETRYLTTAYPSLTIAAAAATSFILHAVHNWASQGPKAGNA